MAYCLPPKFASAFVSKLKDGTINPADLADMSSADRRKFFVPIVGAENAQEVNALFESKLLLKNVKRGLVTWAKTVGGINEPTRKDLLAKIGRMPTDLLNPVDESKFLADLAATKLGVTVTADEAKQIFELSQATEIAKALMQRSLNPTTWTAYGKAQLQLVEAVEAMKPNARSLSERILDITSVTKSAMSTADLSAPLVQGWGSMSTPEFWEGIPLMFKYFNSEDALQNLRGYIAGHPDYELMRKAKLGIVELSDRLTLREEAIQSSLVERANTYLNQKYGVPNIVRMSNRAFVGFLNYVRIKSAENMLAAVRMSGDEVTEQVARDIARVANDFTGRGAIGKGDKYANFTPLNVAIWTPRKISATLNMMNPVRYLDPSIHPVARKAALRRLVGSLTMTGVALGLAKLAGFDVELRETATNFLRIGSGTTYFDATSGNATYGRLIARLIENRSITARGNVQEFGTEFGQTNRFDALWQFFRGKLAPTAGILVDALYGSDPIGRPFAVTTEARDKLVPMTINNFLELAMSDPEMGAVMLSPFTIFGLGMQTQQFDAARGRWDAWGSPQGTDHSDSPVVRKLDELGIEANMPANNIRGVKLSPAMYDEYSYEAGQRMQQYLGAAVATQGFDQGSPGEQETAIRATMQQAREDARMYMMGKYPELVDEADQLKQQRIQQGSPAAVARRAAQ